LELELYYRVTPPGEPGEEVRYWVPLDWEPCHFGGWRPYFLCPNRQCGRRVAILYGGYGRYFLCRRCQNLGYASQRLDPLTRQRRKAQKIRLRLGGTTDLAADFPPRPRGMHWQTYWRWRQQADG
jgi:hypothetical protein